MLALLMMVISSTTLLGQEADDEEDWVPPAGLWGEYHDASGHVAFRVDRRIAFDWNKSRPDERLSAGPFAVKWQGQLETSLTGVFKLFAHAEGHVRITLAGKQILDSNVDSAAWLQAEPIQLEFGSYPIVVEYRRTGQQGRLSLFWEGPDFELEPLSGRRLTHEPIGTPDKKPTVDNFERGRRLTRALRCAACHDLAAESVSLAAPAIDKLPGHLSRSWLNQWLTHAERPQPTQNSHAPMRRMPSFDFSEEEADAIGAFLYRTSSPPDAPEKKPSKTNATTGEHLFHTIGCLACHTIGSLGSDGLFGGGDLGKIASKRPERFFAQWLRDPKSLNRDHQMPVFRLTTNERFHLAAYLATLNGDPPAESRPANDWVDRKQLDQGRTLIQRARCVNCHVLPVNLPPLASQRAGRLDADSNWNRGCLGDPDSRAARPGYRLASNDRLAIRIFLSMSRDSGPVANKQGAMLIEQHNCGGCHSSDLGTGLAGQFNKIIEAHPELAAALPAMKPPSLESIGDKLHKRTMHAVLGGKDLPRREWLQIRMPQFPLSAAAAESIVEYFVTRDRVPEIAFAHDPDVTATGDLEGLKLAGKRLVTADGFGCTSCHAIGDVKAPKGPLATRGPSLSMPSERMRQRWFRRFVHNPLRIVPRIEMPSIQLAVRGVLGDQLDRQLDAVWHVLNEPGFQPPQPGAVRVVRASGLEPNDGRATLLTDVLRFDDKTYLSPLLIGLPNRHAALFDCETGRLVRWSLGDIAHQRTEGKSWYWQAAGSTLLASERDHSELLLFADGEEWQVQRQGQFATEIDSITHLPGGAEFHHRLHFVPQENSSKADRRVLSIKQRFVSAKIMTDESRTEFRRTWKITNLKQSDVIRLHVADSPETDSPETGSPETGSPETGKLHLSDDRHTVWLDDRRTTSIRVEKPAAASFSRDATGDVVLEIAGRPDSPSVEIELVYSTTLPIDTFPQTAGQPLAAEIKEFDTIPGFQATRLPLPIDMMPTNLTWQPNGRLVICSLKGRVWLAEDTNGDSLEDKTWPFSDELAAPYGAHAGPNYIDVVNKSALLRLHDDNDDGLVDRSTTLASGWGHTADYHDWAVGLPRDPDGNYYIALPCQQDDRPRAATKWRGSVLKLSPRTPDDLNPQLFSIRELSAGHRFPMGIARNRLGEMFVSDNQGNWNPFNEINHVVAGARYGFINKIDRRPRFSPPETPPAVALPHPWTRSVNGICFLETPDAVRGRLGRSVFGPFEGHLVGCEYDTRRLVRISLQHVDGVIQGGCYPLSRSAARPAETLLGPLCCAVAPDGDLYVGSIRDSGWGGANNVGEVVRLRPHADGFPPGIAEVRAIPEGLVIDFTQAIDAKQASQPRNYVVSSYRRISTPAYGGDDVDRRSETIASVEVASDARSVTLGLKQLREGFVYELRLKNIASQGKRLFPNEAYYTMRRVPKAKSTSN